MFLNASKGDVELAVKKLKKYYKLKHSSPEFFKDRNLDSEEIQKSFENLIFVALPITPDNNLAFCHKLRSVDPKVYDFDGACKTFIMKVEVTSCFQGPRDGVIFIDDLEGASVSHIFRASLNSVRKSMKFLQDGSPLEIKAIHVMNTPPFINNFISVAKPFMKAGLFKKIHFHSPNVDYKEFQQKHGIPSSHLPSNYGGDLPTLETMHLKQQDEIMEMREYFQLEEAQTHNEYDHLAEEFEGLQSSGKLPK